MKKSTKIISAVLASLMLVAAGCGSDKPAEKKAGGPEEKVLTVYSARSEQLNNAVIPQFEKDTGIKVNLVVAGTGEVLKRAKSEKIIRWVIFCGRPTKRCCPLLKICLWNILPLKTIK